jgi:hypothetical protein
MNYQPGFVNWTDVEDAAREMFRVWVDGGELQWARECWQHLTKKGLTSNSSLLEENAVYLRLVALARYYAEFCERAWDEVLDRSLDDTAENLDIDPVALGILAATARPKAFKHVVDESELREEALEAVTSAMRREIFDCLAEAYGGDIALYSRMSQTNRSSDEEDDGDEFDVSGYNMRALEYVRNGFCD